MLETAAKQYSVDIKCGARVTNIKTIAIPSTINTENQITTTTTATAPMILAIPLPLPLPIPLPTPHTGIENSKSETTGNDEISNTEKNKDVVVKSSKKLKNIVKEILPSVPSQFMITYVTSSSAVFDTMKNSKIESNKNVIQNDENEGGDAEERRPKEEKILICDKVIFATGGSRCALELFYFQISFSLSFY